MKLYVKNTLAGLVPLYASDLDQKRKLKLNETYEVDIRRPRNLAFHRKFFSLIELAWQNTPIDLPKDPYRKWLIKKAGFIKTYIMPDGSIQVEAESISFANMDDDQFSEVYNRVLDVIIEHLGCTKDEIMQQLINYT